jgi:hypothetical protein
VRAHEIILSHDLSAGPDTITGSAADRVPVRKVVVPSTIFSVGPTGAHAGADQRRHQVVIDEIGSACRRQKPPSPRWPPDGPTSRRPRMIGLSRR